MEDFVVALALNVARASPCAVGPLSSSGRFIFLIDLNFLLLFLLLLFLLSVSVALIVSQEFAVDIPQA